MNKKRDEKGRFTTSVAWKYTITKGATMYRTNKPLSRLQIMWLRMRGWSVEKAKDV